MVQRGDGAGFLLEAGRVLALQLFNRDDAVKTRVTRLPHWPMPPAPMGAIIS
jgi:hypothetical protein